MTNTGQIVAALAGGALLAIAVMLVIRLRAIERRAEQQRRIDSAVRAIVGGVQSFRRDWPQDEINPKADAACTAVEVHTKAHLRLIVPARPARTSGRRQQAPDGPRPASAHRR